MTLSEHDTRELRLLVDNPKYGSSDRVRDRARARLKHMGLIVFDRAKWEWKVLLEGYAALK